MEKINTEMATQGNINTNTALAQQRIYNEEENMRKIIAESNLTRYRQYPALLEKAKSEILAEFYRSGPGKALLLAREIKNLNPIDFSKRFGGGQSRPK